MKVHSTFAHASISVNPKGGDPCHMWCSRLFKSILVDNLHYLTQKGVKSYPIPLPWQNYP